MSINLRDSYELAGCEPYERYSHEDNSTVYPKCLFDISIWTFLMKEELFFFSKSEDVSCSR